MTGLAEETSEEKCWPLSHSKKDSHLCQEWNTVKPGFHYPSWWPELTGDRFPLPVNTGRVDRSAFPLAKLTARVDGPSTRAVNSGSGNRALVERLQDDLTIIHVVVRNGPWIAGSRLAVLFLVAKPYFFRLACSLFTVSKLEFFSAGGWWLIRRLMGLWKETSTGWATATWWTQINKNYQANQYLLNGDITNT